MTERLKVATFTTVFPNFSEPSLGTFVRTRIHHVAVLADVEVISPIAWMTYSGFPRRMPKLRTRAEEAAGNKVPVVHPRWFYPPAGGALNALLLFLQALPGVLRLRRVFPFQVIDAHFAHPDGTAAALLALCLKLPFTVTLRGVEVEHARPALRRAIMRWSLRRAGRVICVSENLRGLAISLGVAPERAVVIPNGVNTDVFFPRDRQHCRSKHSLPSEARLVLSAGHLIELKGHHRIVRAVKSMIDSGMPVKLVIAGGAGRRGAYREELHRLVDELHVREAVTFAGEVTPDALAELMCAADVFCLASSREGWPNVVHEALSCGTPVVATKVGAVPELLTSDRYGIIVRPNDAVDLEAGLKTALSHSWDRNAISQWGRARSWDQVAREVVAHLSEVVRERSGDC